MGTHSAHFVVVVARRQWGWERGAVVGAVRFGFPDVVGGAIMCPFESVLVELPGCG